VLATVVRYWGGVKLGAGGLVRAYTDAVAQALLGATKVPRLTLCPLVCQVPYDLEGWLRRQLAAAGATLGAVAHGSVVTVPFSLPQEQAPGLVATLDDGGQGRLVWLKD
jgi:putative IMPACT (imprinted ancient) family translation regulator